ncbi:NADPH-dependent FMN reductase [Aquisalimonas sp.]|uniref:NADPH-dependent FMN reductase n=1 Tax=Aquisalimonas sp. TaxID=1872621 RepID=UPI0025BBDBFB|nr:NADPH-dependent FMN reductase [Aquisalimonas sp.]
MPHLIALSGSLRRQSHNTALARALAELAPDGWTVDVVTPAGVPLYDGDVEAEHGVPDVVTALKDRIAAADGLILVTPEYNQGVPGVFKNTIDWLTRPPKDIARVFRGKPVALCGATPGGGGTRSSQYGWLPILRTLGTRVYSEHLLLVPGAGKVFSADGELLDQDIRDRAQALMEGFCRFAEG